MPIARIELILSDLDVTNVLATSKVTSLSDYNLINFDCELDKSFTHEKLLRIQRKPDIAYIIYTSGSTGKPKGCIVGFESFNPIIQSFIEYYKINANSCMTFVANITFDASMLEWVPALVTESKVHIIDRALLLNRLELIDYYHQHHISFTWLPTTIVEGLIRDESIKLPISLKTIQTAGQRLTARPPSTWHTKVENAYGPKECTVIVSSSKVEPEKKGLPDIGNPLSGIQCYIIDKNKRLVEKGTKGELVVSGIGISRGYWGDKELTQKKFTELNIGGGKKKRVYFTGDICRFNAEGNLEFVERKDKQIKLNGFRIELNEIYESLLALDKVEQAHISLKKIGSHDLLLAYVIAPRIDDYDESFIKQKLKQYLPNYMVPSSIQKVSRFPLTINQKVDESKLPIPKTTESVQPQKWWLYYSSILTRIKIKIIINIYKGN